MMTADFAAQRLKMVDGQLRTTDVTDRAVLDAMLTVPREEFVPARRRALAYIDEDIEVRQADDSGPARFLMEPSPFARLLQLAALGRGDFVLDVGCATGYSSAVISQLAGSVVALEADDDLAYSATTTLDRLGYDNVAVVRGPLAAGFEAEAPYDCIVVEGAVETVPDALLGQLRDGGRLVAVVGLGAVGQATIFRRQGEVVSRRRAFNAAVRPLAEFLSKPEFQF
jgi:protein-L-isoaspartate(D-aspartate) O-methyltransferase